MSGLNLVYQKYCIHVNLIKKQQQPYNPNDEHTIYQTEKKTHLYFKGTHDSHLKIAQHHPVVFYTNN